MIKVDWKALRPLNGTQAEGFEELCAHHLIRPDRYQKLKNDTLIKCEQIYTINREYFTDYRFTLEKSDLIEVRRRMASIIGF